MWQTKSASAIPKNLGLGFDSRAVVKVILTPGVRSPWIERKTLITGGLDFLVMWQVVCEITPFGKWFLYL